LIDRNQDLWLHGNQRSFGSLDDQRRLAAKTGYLLEGYHLYEDYKTDGTVTNKGAIFVFSDSGAFLGRIDNPNASGTEVSDQFGWALKFRLDGNRLIVSALNEDPLSGANQGYAYLYDTSDSNWENWTLLNAYAMPNQYSPTTSDGLNAVAVSDDYVIAGHRYEDSSTYTNIGVVHVFNANAPYNYVRTISNPAPLSNEYFGYDVDIYGSTAIIGAPYDDTNTTDAGIAYIFNVSNGSQIASVYDYEYSSYRSSGYFGRSVTMNSDRIVVGAYNQGDYPGRLGVGFAYVYTHSGGFLGQLQPTSTAYRYVGWQVDINAAGVVVLGTSASNGVVYRYDCSGGVPSYIASSTNLNIDTRTADDYYGRAIAIERNSTSTTSYKWYAGAAYEDTESAYDQGIIYHFTHNTYNGYIRPPEDGILSNDTRENDPRLGNTVSMNERYAVAGARQAYDWGEGNSNSVYRYSGIVNVYDARNNFAKTQTIRNLNIYSTKQDDYFGTAVELQRDGDLLAIQAHSEDSYLYSSLGVVYIYDLGTNTLQRVIENPNPDTTSSTDSFGYGFQYQGAIAIDDTYIAIGAYTEEAGGYTNAGRVYVWNHTNGLNQVNLTSPNYKASGYFGIAVSMAGNTLAVGAYGEGTSTDGNVYLFNKLNGTLLSTIFSPNLGNSTGDYFGAAVKISPDGNYMVVGAPREDFVYSNSGSVYLYDISNPSSPVELWNKDGGGTSQYLGGTVDISNQYVVSGAYGYDGASIDTGRAFVWDLDGNEVSILYPTNPYNLTQDAYTNYGYSVAVNNNANVVVGEQLARKTQHEDDYGAVYFYR
jgi:hypothetical protein